MKRAAAVVAALLCLALPALVLADEIDDLEEEVEKSESAAEKKQKEKPKGPTDKGRWDIRGGVNLDLDKTINLGGDSGDARSGGGVNLGIGYFVANNLALDLDNRVSFLITPETELERAQTTPGLRFHPTPTIFVRAGAPIVFAPDFNTGVLAGAGYRQPLGTRAAFIIGVDYTYWLSGPLQDTAPDGQIDLNAGIQTSF